VALTDCTDYHRFVVVALTDCSDYHRFVVVALTDCSDYHRFVVVALTELILVCTISFRCLWRNDFRLLLIHRFLFQ